MSLFPDNGVNAIPVYLLIGIGVLGIALLIWDFRKWKNRKK